MSLKKLAGETAIYGLSSIVGRILNFVLVPLYTAALPPGDYSIVLNLFPFAGIVMVFFTHRMELAYFRFGTENQQEEHRSFNAAIFSVIFSTAILGLLALVFSSTISGWLGYLEYSNLFRILMVIVIIDALSEIPYAKLRLEQRPIRFATIRLTTIGLNIGLNLFFLLFCPYALQSDAWSFLHPFLNLVYNEEALVAYIFISNLIGNSIGFLLLSPTLFRIRWREFDLAIWKKMFRYALPLLVVGISYLLNETFDRLAMPRLLAGTLEENKIQLGIYGACYKLTMFLTLFTQAFRYGAEPFFFRQKTAENAKEIYANVAKFFSIIGAIGFLSVLLYLDILKPLFLRQEIYWEGIGVVPILLLANLFLGIYYNLSIWYKLTDQTKWGAYISIFGAVLTVVLNIIFLPIFGYFAAAWITFLCYFMMMVVSYWLGQRKYSVPYEVRKITFYIVVAVAMYGLSEWVRSSLNENLWGILGVNTLILLLYLSFIYEREKKAIRQFF
ncbi:MAG: polysaccharide biosynthesis C-terminal domain-containing protein [Bacteroidota bacterium]